MGSIHGSMLVHFTEEFRPFTYFQMTPRVTSGFEERTDVRKSRGVVHMYSAPPTAEGVKLREVNTSLVIEKKPFLWCRTVIPVGWFVEFGDDVYRVLSHNEWEFEASMTIHGLERVVGDNGTVTNEPSYNLGNDFLG